MAKMNGMELKNIREFFGHDGETDILYSADIYLQNKKIGIWQQDFMHGEDMLELDDKFDLNKLVDKIALLNDSATNPFETSFDFQGPENRPWSEKFKYCCLEIMLPNLIQLREWKKYYKNNCMKIGKSLGIATDGFHEYTCKANGYTKEGLIEQLKKEDLKFFGNCKPAYFVFESLKDFEMYTEVILSDICTDKQLKKQKHNEIVR